MNSHVESSEDTTTSPESSMVGIATATFMTIRGKEECYRAQRYGRPLALVVVSLDQTASASESRLRSWLRSQTRMSDVVAYLGKSVYAMLLPESDEQAASGLISRMRTAVPQLRAFSGRYPMDGTTWEDFLDSVRRKTGEVPEEQKAG